MTGFLLDTDVVSLLATPERDGFGQFSDWLEHRDREGRVFLSVVAIHEIRKGIALLEHRGATAKASAPESWLTGLRAGYADRILELDLHAAQVSGKIEARALATGHSSGMADAMVAGIAEAQGLVVITRNVKHFRALGISAVTPEEIVKER